MTGFPDRPGRTAFGPDFVDMRPVANPNKEIPAETFNLDYWQTGGLSKVSPLALFRCSVSGTTVTNNFQSLAFDPKGEQSEIAFSYEGKGHYKFSFSAFYPNEKGHSTALNMIGGIAASETSHVDSGTHDGGDGQAILTDSTKSWTPSAYVDNYVYNWTDGSWALITANTGTTVTGTLADGTDDDWDDGDKYSIMTPYAYGMISRFNAIEVGVFFFDKDRKQVDPTGFIVVMW